MDIAEAGSPSGLPLTGERTVPGVAGENYWYRRHEAAYLAVVPHCAGATVLDAGCGEGYGADLLARTARRVLAVDYDELTAAHVARTYPQVEVIRSNLAMLPITGAAVDVVVSMQVIEHLWDQKAFLAECRRVLRPGGQLLITTPNRLTFSPGSDTPLNPFHTRELAPLELAELLSAAGFTVRSLRGLRHGPKLRELDDRLGGSIIEAQVRLAVTGTPPAADLLTAVASVASEDFVITDEDLDGSLDLVAIAVAP
ncbi:MAG: class I SAM-dependent methyltransferase [Kutzneria sp.]|nr:class I SAM-dependent methyltransferase [Kutzneria sp.]